MFDLIIFDNGESHKKQSMNIVELLTDDKFSFEPKQVVRLTNYTADGEFTETETCGTGTKGRVIRKNRKSIRVEISFRDKDRGTVIRTMKYINNFEVKFVKK